MTETYRGALNINDQDNSLDFLQWEVEIDQMELAGELDLEIEREASSPSDLELEAAVLEQPEEPKTAWVESSGVGPTESEYLQQSRWVIGQFGHMIDCVRQNITSESEAREWLEMKMSIAAAKSETNANSMIKIRSRAIPIWAEYVTKMNYDTEEFARVCNR